MIYRKVEDGYLVRLDRGDEIIGSLTALADKEKITAAFISGIGAVHRAKIGIYDRAKQDYLTKSFPGELEVGNLTGNITIHEETGRPFVHVHITVSDQSLAAYTGHLLEATVLVTFEIYMRVFEEKLIRGRSTDERYYFWQL